MLIFYCECGQIINGRKEGEVLHRALKHFEDIHQETFIEDLRQKEIIKNHIENAIEKNYYH